MSAGARTLLLITASSPEIRRVRRACLLNFQQITMPYLAALVPSHWTVRHIDEAAEPLDLSAQADLVAITFHTSSAPHAYALAARFRQRGITVALGGPHITLVPDEAQAHADVIFVGEAVRHWPRFLAEQVARTCSGGPRLFIPSLRLKTLAIKGRGPTKRVRATFL